MTRFAGSEGAMNILFGEKKSPRYDEMYDLGLKGQSLLRKADIQGQVANRKADIRSDAIREAGKYGAMLSANNTSTQANMNFANSLSSTIGGLGQAFGSRAIAGGLFGGGGGGGLGSLGGFSAPQNAANNMFGGSLYGFRSLG